MDEQETDNELAKVVEKARHERRMKEIMALLEFDCKPNNEGYGVENVHNPGGDIPHGTEAKDTQYVGRRQAFAYLISRMIAVYHNETLFDHGIEDETGVIEFAMDQYVTLTEAGDPEYNDNIEVKWRQGQTAREWVQVAQAENLPLPGWYDGDEVDSRLIHGDVVYWYEYKGIGERRIRSGVVVGFVEYAKNMWHAGQAVAIKEDGYDHSPRHLFAHQLTRDQGHMPPYSPDWSNRASVEEWRVAEKNKFSGEAA